MPVRLVFQLEMAVATGCLRSLEKKRVQPGLRFRLDRLLRSTRWNRGKLPEFDCIFFSQERRKEAFQLAKKMHAEGKRAVLQDINGVKNLDAYTNKFDRYHLSDWESRKGACTMNRMLTIAMPKGRIFEEAADLLRKAGYKLPPEFDEISEIDYRC